MAVRSGGAQRGIQTPLVYGERGCGAHHRRREALEAAAQADPGLRDAALALTGRPEDDDEGHRQGLYYPWDQDSLGVADPLDRVSCTDLQMRFITVVKVKPNLATTHARLITQSLGLVNHALGAHRPSGSPNTPNYLFRELKLWYILPALLHSQGGRLSLTERFQSAERGDLTTILPWLMEYTKDTATRLRGLEREATDAAKFERAASACRHQGGITVAAHSLLAELHAPGNEATWTTVKAKFPDRKQQLRPSSSGGS